MGPGNRNYNQVKERGGYRTCRRGEGVPRQDKGGRLFSGHQDVPRAYFAFGITFRALISSANFQSP
jgi:hypothetical protein